MHLDFLYTAVSWVLLRWHHLFTVLGLDPDHGPAWALSIVALVLTARSLLIPVFLRQLRSQRTMQRLQPRTRALRERHRDDRPALNRAMLELQRAEGFNPVAGCLPMLVQIPVFLGLYHVLQHVAHSAALCHGGATSSLLGLYSFSGGAGGTTCSAAGATLFGAPLAAHFDDGADAVHALGGDLAATRYLVLALLVVSAAATWLTQRSVSRGAPVPAEGSSATVARIVRVVLPVGVLVSGLLFPIPVGVLLYWCTTNLWTLGQQWCVSRRTEPEPVAVAAASTRRVAAAPRVGARPVGTDRGRAKRRRTPARR